MDTTAILYDDEIQEAETIALRLRLIETSILVKGPLDTDCWIWVGGSSGNGYGHMYWPQNDRHAEYAHRISWIAFNGPIPEGLWVLHKCDTKACIRPDHLYLGTCQDNVDDREARGGRSHRHLTILDMAFVVKPKRPNWRRI